MFKKTTFLLSAFALLLTFSACSQDEPLTEAEQAEAQGITLEEYRETKAAAARMNMSVEDHMNMGH